MYGLPENGSRDPTVAHPFALFPKPFQCTGTYFENTVLAYSFNFAVKSSCHVVRLLPSITALNTVWLLKMSVHRLNWKHQSSMNFESLRHDPRRLPTHGSKPSCSHHFLPFRTVFHSLWILFSLFLVVSSLHVFRTHRTAKTDFFCFRSLSFVPQHVLLLLLPNKPSHSAHHGPADHFLSAISSFCAYKAHRQRPVRSLCSAALAMTARRKSTKLYTCSTGCSTSRS